MLPRLIGLWAIAFAAWLFSNDAEWGPVLFVEAWIWMIVCIVGADRDARGLQ